MLVQLWGVSAHVTQIVLSPRHLWHLKKFSQINYPVLPYLTVYPTMKQVTHSDGDSYWYNLSPPPHWSLKAEI